jgi:hypothetical protein
MEKTPALPTPLEAMREKRAKIETEITRCRKLVDDLRLNESPAACEIHKSF